MACYCGCGTPANKVAWVIVGVTAFIGVVLIHAGVIGNYRALPGESCFQVWDDCVNDDYPSWYHSSNSVSDCYDLADKLCNLVTWLGLLATGVLLLIISALATSFFCCCSKRPSSDQVTGAANGQFIQAGMPEAASVAGKGAAAAPAGGLAYPVVASAEPPRYGAA